MEKQTLLDNIKRSERAAAVAATSGDAEGLDTYQDETWDTLIVLMKMGVPLEEIRDYAPCSVRAMYMTMAQTDKRPHEIVLSARE